jgi:hypothetical protein
MVISDQFSVISSFADNGYSLLVSKQKKETLCFLRRSGEPQMPLLITED